MPTLARYVAGVDPAGLVHSRALCESAVTLAATGHADAIVAVTREGKTARLLSALRPSAPIVRRHAARRGRRLVDAVLGRHADPDRRARCREARSAASSSQRLIGHGAVVVFVSVQPDLTRTDTNFLNVQKIG